ncbi:hypothetical protein [Paraburkholderia ginsengiterrae]|nr:hypothetical protein [Paraburkholderia ginsengiterrae]
MNLTSIRDDAFAMRVHNQAYPRPPYRLINREYFTGQSVILSHGWAMQ